MQSDIERRNDVSRSIAKAFTLQLILETSRRANSLRFVKLDIRHVQILILIDEAGPLTFAQINKVYRLASTTLWEIIGGLKEWKLVCMDGSKATRKRPIQMTKEGKKQLPEMLLWLWSELPESLREFSEKELKVLEKLENAVRKVFNISLIGPQY